MTNFGDFIKEQRELKGWTQTDFGAKLGINSSAISRIEKGSKRLTPKKLNIIADLFGCDIMKVKEIYFANVFAEELYKYDCPESALTVAEQTVRFIKQKHQQQSELKF